VSATTDNLLRIRPESLSLATDAGPADAFEIELGGVPRGLVVLLVDDFAGLDAFEIMNRFAERGYETLAVPGGVAAAWWSAIASRATGRRWAAEQTGVVGIGAGGRIALGLAASYGLGAAVSVSPPLTSAYASADAPSEQVGTVRTPWLGLFGEDDPAAPAEQTSRLAARLRAGSDVFTQIVRYPGVGRDFHRESADGLSYAASYDSWQRVLEWLDARVAPRLTPLAEAWRERSRQR